MNDMTEMFGNTPLDKEAAENKKEAASVSEFNGRDYEGNNKRINQLFQEVFGTEHGRIVLGIMLEDLYYFRNCANDESRTLNNYAKVLLSQRLGFIDNQKRIDSLFNA